MYGVQQHWESCLHCLNITNSNVKRVSERLGGEERFLFYIRQISNSWGTHLAACIPKNIYFLHIFKNLNGLEIK